jgi:enamine deaminase RidA (YjgF/YER057c/UK114 family)
VSQCSDDHLPRTNALQFILVFTFYCSQAVVVDSTVYLSGVLGLDPSTNKLVDGNTVAQAKQAFINLKNILEAANSSYENGNVRLYNHRTNFIP